jgi:hypothetical protein
VTAADGGDDARDPQRQASPAGPATLIARFQVDSFEPRQVTGLDADWVGLMTFAKTFTSGIVGQATTLFMSAWAEACRARVSAATPAGVS